MIAIPRQDALARWTCSATTPRLSRGAATPVGARFVARILARVFALALTWVGPLDAQGSFTLGSTTDDVRRAQGTPSVVQRLRSLGVEIWSYGQSTIRFSSDSLRVVGWENVGGTLHVALPRGPHITPSTTFGAGSHRDDVVRLMGTPNAVRESRSQGTATWRYGASSITISLEDDRVVGWSNAGRNLRVATAPTGTVATPAARGATPDGPVTLEAWLTFREPSGNGALDGGETGRIVARIRNRGPGIARRIRLSLTPDSGVGLGIGALPVLDRLDARAEAHVEIPITAHDRVRDGTATLRLEAREQGGFDLEPARRITIPVRAAEPPRLTLDGIRAEDQSGDRRLSARELVEVTVRVRNSGAGEARDVRASIVTGADIFLAEERARSLVLGAMRPGEHRDLIFSVYTNTRARDVRVLLSLTEASGRHGLTIPVPLAVERPVPGTLDVVVSGGAPGTPHMPTDGAPLVDDVERLIPRAAAPNADAIAVVLGVEWYRALPGARFAARDAQLFRRYAVTTLGVPDDRNHLYVRTDGEATGNELRKLFGDDGWLARRVRRTTDLYVYFSGHGAPDVKTRTPYLLPSDADASYPRETGYALATLYTQLAKLEVRSVTVFLDACFTGATRSNGTLFAGARPIVISIEHPALARDNFVVFAAARGDELASDYPARRHGLFTYQLLRGMGGAADGDGDRTITVAELARHLDEQVPAAAASLDREQHPLVIARDMARPLVRLEPERAAPR